jgi:hypothetical protein
LEAFCDGTNKHFSAPIIPPVFLYNLSSIYTLLHQTLCQDGFQGHVDCVVYGVECDGRGRTITKSSAGQYRIGETCQARDCYDNDAPKCISDGVPELSRLLELEIDML